MRDDMLTPPAQLKYLFEKNNNNKLSSTQKINCAQQSDRQEGPFNALHRGARQGEATPANRGARGTERVLKSDAGFRASGGRAPGCGLSPSEPSLPLLLLTSALSSVSWPVSLHLLGRYCQRLSGQEPGRPAVDLSTATARE